MSRSGYSDDHDPWDWGSICWRGAVASAIRGKRGQSFLREMVAAMDALPGKKLIANDLETADGEVCAIGSVGKARGIDMSTLDPEDYSTVANIFGINEKLVREIVYMNDEAFNGYWCKTPEERFRRMRDWVTSHLREATP